MADFCTPKEICQLPMNRMPDIHTLSVDSIHVRCSTPIVGKLRSPNLSPIRKDKRLKSPASPMIFAKQMHKAQQHSEKSAANPVKNSGLDDDSNSSLNNFLDDSSANSMETSLTLESRRRSIQAANHSYVLNHATNVKEVLLLVGLETYLDKFEDSHIDLLELVSMKRSDLKSIGVRKDEDCNRILEALKEL
ncbi:PREDICTED: protein matrimony [Drosophila arizonae]|uniref:Protein matrimony n=1 Tax=Drosophila arizonae TaxID=7263 RepID=A0ABM1P2A0_DROAR|nr:PREDICTED: protein matrimony [Drosophila arizonae]